MDERKVREVVVALLEEKGFKVIDKAKGQGVARLSRLEIQKPQGARQTCVVKTSTGGRISFTRESDGSFKVLRDFDYVIHAQPVADDEKLIRIRMFERQTIEDAFEANYIALSDHRMGHLPSWVSPDSEAGWRQTGSGFGKKALWSETRPLTPDAPVITSSAHPTTDAPLKLTIAQAKAGLAATFGVSLDAIEIIVRA